MYRQVSRVWADENSPPILSLEIFQDAGINERACLPGVLTSCNKTMIESKGARYQGG